LKNEKEKLEWYNNENVFIPIYLGIVGIAGLIIIIASYFR